jgi:CheY-like chemotaxis protein
MAENIAELPQKFSTEINVIRRNVRLEARLIDDLLDLTRVSTGKIELHQQRLDGHSIARDALSIARSDIHRKKLIINTDFTAKDHFVFGDPVRLEQVYWNLINNAVKFTPANGEIRIQTWNQDGEFNFAITDTGIGIDVDKQKSLFTAFEQGERGISRRFGGLGLGLTICKNLVELHGGTIRISSRGRSMGTTASVSLKSYFGPEVSVQDEVNLPAGPARLRILVVEDHEDTRHVLSRLLTKLGCETTMAGTVSDAVRLLRSQPFDALLSDIGLPDGAGYDVIAEAKRVQDLKGVALTGYGMSEDVRRSKEAGFDWHLTKPVDATELRTVLHRLSQKATSAKS